MRRSGNGGGCGIDFELDAWLALHHVEHFTWYPQFLVFLYAVFCKEEVLLVKEIINESDTLLGLPILALELELEFLGLVSGLRMVRFFLLLSVAT